MILNLHALPTVIASLLGVTLGLLIIRQKPSSSVKRIFALFCFAASFWQIGYAGMYSVKSIIEAHKGKINVQSGAPRGGILSESPRPWPGLESKGQPQRGTTVKIKLPVTII